MKYPKPNIIIAILFLICSELFVAQNNISFDHLNIEDGLSQSVVTCIFQDDKGFMWFGTQDGLNRYDGYTFKVFRNDPNDPTTLKDNFIFSIYQSNEGPMYVETQKGNFHEYDPFTESFSLVDKDAINLFDTRYSSISALYIDPNGIIWTGGGSRNTGLIREDKNTGEITTFKNDPNDKNSLSSDRVYSIYKDHFGKLWIGTYKGLDILDEETGEFTHFNDITTAENNLSTNWVWPVYEDTKGIIWIGTVNGGLNRYDPKSKSVKYYKNISSDPWSLSHDFIFSIYEDRSGVIWIGTNTGGINYFHPARLVFEHFINNPDNPNSLSDNEVLSAFVDNNGIYWIGTRSGGLNRFDYARGKFESIIPKQGNKNGLISNTIQTLYQDSKGILWIGTIGSGLQAYDERTKYFTSYVSNSSDPNSLSDNRIFSLLEDKNGIIWIGTYGGGLNKLNPKTKRIKSYQFKDDDSTSISSNATWSLVEDNEGSIWVGTFGGGLNIFDQQNEQFRRIQSNPDDQNSLPDNNVVKVFKDSKNNIWVGTTKGLSKYLRDDNNFKNYNTSDGLPNDLIYALLEDDKGNLWISTNNGLSRFNPDEETFKNFSVKDGLQGNEFNQNAFAKDFKTGRMLFGGLNGFNIFHPDSIKENSYIPPIEFTNFLRFNTDNKEGKPIFENGISVRDNITLSYKDNIIYFEFSALSYYNNLSNQYKYRLEGFNENWIQMQSERDITFTNLSPGEYTLKVLGSNNDGVWNNEGKELAITVLPPWWRTNYAYAAYFLIILGSLYSIRRFEINRREQKAQVREAELKMKATEAEKRTLQIENERKTKELDDARQMQLSMLPKEVPEHPDLEIAVFMRTATEVGGDYYDFFLQDDGTLNIAFGDATGHGLQAGTMVTLMKGFFTADAKNLNLQDFMKHCSKLIKEIKLGRILMSFTCMKIFDNKFQVSSGGMPPIYFYNSQSEVMEEIVIKGMPLGAMANFPYNLYEKDLRSGDTILLITDGLPEQMNDKEEMYDYSRVKDKYIQIVDKKPKEIIDSFIESCDAWRNSINQDDDITLMVIKVK